MPTSVRRRMVLGALLATALLGTLATPGHASAATCPPSLVGKVISGDGAAVAGQVVEGEQQHLLRRRLGGSVGCGTPDLHQVERPSR